MILDFSPHCTLLLKIITGRESSAGMEWLGVAFVQALRFQTSEPGNWSRSLFLPRISLQILASENYFLDTGRWSVRNYVFWA